MNNQLSKCLQLISSPESEEKLAGLHLLTKVLTPDADEATFYDTFAALDHSFVHKLLQSSEPGFCTLALNVLSVFARASWNIRISKHMAAYIPTMARIVSQVYALAISTVQGCRVCPGDLRDHVQRNASL